MQFYRVIFALFFGLWIFTADANFHFRVLPLGTSGGEFENNLSAYLVSTNASTQWLALDAGSLCGAIHQLSEKQFAQLNLPTKPAKTDGAILLENVGGFLLSHAHQDHIAGLIICAPTLGKKSIYGINTTIDYLRDYIFNWKIWPNFADEGQKPWLNQLHYQRLNLNAVISVPQTGINIKPFILNHGNGYPSTAFLLSSHGYALLYFGDTGPDQIEHSHDIQAVWRTIAPLIRQNRLRGIFIETSYPNEQPNPKLYGHLTPYWLLQELRVLAKMVNPQNPKSALQKLKIVVTHVKQGFEGHDESQVIMQQLNSGNDLGVIFIRPKQNRLMIF